MLLNVGRKSYILLVATSSLFEMECWRDKRHLAACQNPAVLLVAPQDQSYGHLEVEILRKCRREPQDQSYGQLEVQNHLK